MNAAADAPRKPLAHRISYLLAFVGFIGFSGTIWLLASSATVAHANSRGWSGEAAELRAGVAIILAMVAHAVGVGLAFAAPRGHRLLPALLNGISLAIQIAVIAAGLTADV